MQGRDFERRTENAPACHDTDANGSDIEFYVVCSVCGQIYDCRNTRQAAHHTEALHDPLIDGS